MTDTYKTTIPEVICPHAKFRCVHDEKYDGPKKEYCSKKCYIKKTQERFDKVFKRGEIAYCVFHNFENPKKVMMIEPHLEYRLDENGRRCRTTHHNIVIFRFLDNGGETMNFHVDWILKKEDIGKYKAYLKELVSKNFKKTGNRIVSAGFYSARQFELDREKNETD